LDWLVDPTPTQEITLAEEQETAYRHRALNNAISNLNQRECRIFTARWLTDEPATLEELAAEYGISGERVRQIEQRAFQKVKAAVQALGHSSGGPVYASPKNMKQQEATALAPND
jgi:RNA polymerase sigma-32 factor